MSSITLGDVIEAIRGVMVKVEDVSTRLDAVEVSLGKNDKPITIDEKQNFNTDPGPSVSLVFTNKCITCGESFQTQKQGAAICEKCRLVALEKSNAQLRRFEAQGD